METKGPRVRSLPISAARRALRAPASWRLWIASLAVVAAQAVPYALPALALIIMYLFWRSLHPYASPYVDPGKRRHSLTDFTANLLAVCGYLMLAVTSLAAAIGPDSTPVVVIAALCVSFCLAMAMFQWWWGFGYALLASLAIVTVGTAAVVIAPIPVSPNLGVSSLWTREFPRLLGAFVAAGGIGLLVHRRGAKRTRPTYLVERLLYTLAFVSVLALVNGLGSAAPDEWSMLLAGCAGFGVLHIATLARFEVIRDFRWLRTWRTTDRPAPFGGFVAAAFAPVVALASIDSFPIWGSMLALAVSASLLKAMAFRFPGKQKPAPKKDSVRLVPAA